MVYINKLLKAVCRFMVHPFTNLVVGLAGIITVLAYTFTLDFDVYGVSFILGILYMIFLDILTYAIGGIVACLKK